MIILDRDKRTKLETFIYYLPHRVLKRAYDTLKLRISQLQEIEIEGQKPSVLFQVWLLEIFQYGAMCVFAYATITKMKGWLQLLMLVPTIGMLRWLLLDLLENIKERLK